MTETIDSIKNHLKKRKALLLQRIDQVSKGISQEHSTDWSEQAQERQNDEVLEAIGNESRNELAQINRALERIASGDYTACEQCGENIPLQRLEAVPYTSLCIGCAE